MRGWGGRKIKSKLFFIRKKTCGDTIMDLLLEGKGKERKTQRGLGVTKSMEGWMGAGLTHMPLVFQPPQLYISGDPGCLLHFS